MIEWLNEHWFTLTSNRAEVPIMESNQTLEAAFGIACIIILLAFFIVAIWYVVKKKSSFGIMMLIGGLVCGYFLEPWCDFVGNLTFPTVNTIFPPMVDLFGTADVWWVPIGYGWFVGGGSFLCYMLFKRGITRKGIYGLLAVIFVADLILETVGVHIGTHMYLGYQPLLFAGHALWWPVCGMMLCLGNGFFAYKYEHFFKGWKSVLLILLIPAGFTMFCGFIGWPCWIAIDLNINFVVSNIAGLICILLAYLCLRAIIYEKEQFEDSVQFRANREAENAAMTGKRAGKQSKALEDKEA